MTYAHARDLILPIVSSWHMDVQAKECRCLVQPLPLCSAEGLCQSQLIARPEIGSTCGVVASSQS